MDHADGRLLHAHLPLLVAEDTVTLVVPRALLEEEDTGILGDRQEEDIWSRLRAAVDNRHRYFDLGKTFLECGSPR